MIRVKNVYRRFGDFTAVKDVSFDIPQGEIVGLLGHNGAGSWAALRPQSKQDFLFRRRCARPPSRRRLEIALSSAAMTVQKTIFSPAASITRLIERLPIARRLETRRRLYAFIDEMADRLLREKGPGGARSVCIRRMGFCAHSAQGVRWTIWQQIHKRVRERTNYVKNDSWYRGDPREP